ncbi:hypothetical protein V7134_15870 [Priestia megaterium]|uniref:hypothetical protein n=1 Tax=Priestia megaterium TaxID=1404 RepID=UPI002FFE45F9
MNYETGRNGHLSKWTIKDITNFAIRDKKLSPNFSTANSMFQSDVKIPIKEQPSSKNFLAGIDFEEEKEVELPKTEKANKNKRNFLEGL